MVFVCPHPLTSHSLAFRADGYVTRFGLTYVNFDTQERIPKASGKFVTKVNCVSRVQCIKANNVFQWFQDHIEGLEPVKDPKAHDARLDAAVKVINKSIAAERSHNPSSSKASTIVSSGSLFSGLLAKFRAYLLRWVSLVFGKSQPGKSKVL